MEIACEGMGMLAVDGEPHPAFCLLILSDPFETKASQGKVATEPEILRRAEQADRLTFTFRNGRSFPLTLTTTHSRSGVAHFEICSHQPTPDPLS